MRIGLTADFVDSNGAVLLDAAAVKRLQSIPGAEVDLPQTRSINQPLTMNDVTGNDILITKRNQLDAKLLSRPNLRLKHVARMGVGYDHIDIGAWNAAGVLVTITPEAVRRPVASAILALVLAFAHCLFARDEAARSGDWSRRFDAKGIGLGGRTLGLVGAGNIGSEVIRLVAPFDMRLLVNDPSRRLSDLAALHAEQATLDEVLRHADFLALACPLNDRTRRLISAERLALMKRSAVLINVARGELVDEVALAAALSAGRIAGAGIDVYENEPPPASSALFEAPNTILGQHNLGITDETDRIGHRAVVDAVIEVCQGRLPSSAVNPNAWAQALERMAR